MMHWLIEIYDDGLHGYGMDSGAAAAAMYDPHVGHRPPGLQGLPTHHSPHMTHAAAAAATVGMHGYHTAGAGGHGTPSHSSYPSRRKSRKFLPHRRVDKSWRYFVDVVHTSAAMTAQSRPIECIAIAFIGKVL
ncbi:hypothetical protein GQX74_006417 [Glossina fuscipes]|nr:hypothetical protein GQX74_006417 [Glossina fuscipes]